MKKTFWHQKKVVQAFAGDKPSVALERYLRTIQNPREIHILDLGCGGGRNTEMILKQGFNVYACDKSIEMVQRTKKRLAQLIQKSQVNKKVLKAAMTRLPYRSSTFDIVVSNGVFHNAISLLELEKSLGETARVLKKNGVLYLNMFYSGTTVSAMKKDVRLPDLYRTKEKMQMILLTSKRLLQLLAHFGFQPMSTPSYYRTIVSTGERNCLRGQFIKVLQKKADA